MYVSCHHSPESCYLPVPRAPLTLVRVALRSGFNLRKVQKGSVTLSLWDLSGQPRFRSLWTRYATGVTVLLFVVDAADPGSFAVAREELHSLLRELPGPDISVLVLGNKNDLPERVESREVIKELELVKIKGREVDWYSVSAKSQDNIESVVRWLEKRAR